MNEKLQAKINELKALSQKEGVIAPPTPKVRQRPDNLSKCIRTKEDAENFMKELRRITVAAS